MPGEEDRAGRCCPSAVKQARHKKKDKHGRARVQENVGGVVSRRMKPPQRAVNKIGKNDRRSAAVDYRRIVQRFQRKRWQHIRPIGKVAVFNNGAFAVPGAVEDLPTDALRSIYETNLFGYHEVIRQVIPIMRAQGKGKILNCSSVLGFVAIPWRGAYNSTKFALEGLTDTLRIEMRNTNINVILIEPGPIGTKIRENSIPHFERWVDWENSPRKKQYETDLIKRLYQPKNKPDAFELPVSAVTKVVMKALESHHPKPRYYVTIPTHFMGFLRRILSTRSLDWFISRL